MYHHNLGPNYTKDMENTVKYAVKTNPICVDSKPIKFSTMAEHVGILRSTLGNLPTIMARITAHSRAIGSVVHTGMASGHRGNPHAGLHVKNLYGVPVLLSGLPNSCSLSDVLATKST